MEVINQIMTTYVAMVSLLIRFKVFVLVMTYNYLRLRRRRIHNREHCYSPRPKVARQLEFQTESGSECSKSKKRKVYEYDENDDRVLEAIKLICDKAESKIGEMISQMKEVAQGPGSKFESAKQREALYETLCGFDFLTLETRVRVSRYFADKPNMLDMFYSIPSDAKAALLRNIMDEF